MEVKQTQSINIIVTLTEREAKLLCCLIGAIPSPDAEKYIKQSFHRPVWDISVDERDMIELTGSLYDGLCDSLDSAF